MAPVAQLVEHIHGKDEVSGSIPLESSSLFKNMTIWGLIYDICLSTLCFEGVSNEY